MVPELRGPTDPDNYRVKAGRYGDRFYTDPLPADETWPATTDDDVYPSVSTVKKAAGKDWSYAAYKRLAKAPSQLVEIGQIDSEFERKERIRLISDSGLDGAAARGTIVHAHAEAKLYNRLPIYQPSEEAKRYLGTVDSFFAAYQPKLVAAEMVAIHRDLNTGNRASCDYEGYGGTFDAVIEIDGQLYIVDWKTRADDSDHDAYNEEAMQLGAYGRAQYWVAADPTSPIGAKRIKPVELAGGLIVSIKPDSYEVYPIDLDLGFEAFTDLHAWWQRQRVHRKAVGRKWAPLTAPTGAAPVTVDDAPDRPAPTPASNKAIFNALSDISKDKARKAFKDGGLNPNDPATAQLVYAILTNLDQPTIREMQDARAAERFTEREKVDYVQQQKDAAAALLEAEGGPATDEMIGEAKLLFDMVIGDHGRKWTGARVEEANAAGVSIRISDCRSMRRANLYLAMTNWARFRGDELPSDEAEGNIEFTLLINMVTGPSDEPLGARLASLSAEQAEQLAKEVAEVVTYESDDNPVTPQ